MLRSPTRRLFSPLRLLAVCVPAGVACYVLACGDASNTDAQNYFADSPILTGSSPSDGGFTILSDGAIAPIKDVYVAPVYDSGTTLHDGTLVLASTMTTGASLDLYSSVTIPLTLTSMDGFSGPASLLALGAPGDIGISFQPDDPMVTPDAAGTSNMLVTSKAGQAPGQITFSILATGGSTSVDAGTPVKFTVTVNPRITIDIPTAFENNLGQNLPTSYIGTPANVATDPIKVVFVNEDSANYVLIGASSPQVGFPQGQTAIAPNGGIEAAFSNGYTDAGTARVIDQKTTVNFFCGGYGSTAAIAQGGGGVDGGSINVFKGAIQLQ